MHVPIDNIMSVKDFATKVGELTDKLNNEDVYVITQNDQPKGAYISLGHLTRLARDNEGIVTDGASSTSAVSSVPNGSPPLPPMTGTSPKPSPTLPNWDEKELPTPGAISASSVVPPPLPPLPPLSNMPKPPLPSDAKPATFMPPPPLPPLPPAPKLDDKTALVTESEAKSAVFGSTPTSPKPPDDAPKPPVPPVSSPFSNLSASTINQAPPAPPAGTSSAPNWPTVPKLPDDTKPTDDTKPVVDDDDDDLDTDSII